MYELTPEQQQMMAAQMLRGQSALKDANNRATRFDNLAAVTQLIGNPGAAAAASNAAKSAAARAKPQAMGNMGFMLPDSGDIVASPLYFQDQLERRGQTKALLDDRQAASAEAAAQAQAAALQRTREMLAAQQQRAEELRAFQAQQGEANRALRMTIAAMQQQRSADAAAAKDKEKSDKDRDRAVLQLADRAQKLGIPRLLSNASALAKEIEDAEATGKGVPGIGYGSDLMSRTPLIGDWALGERGQTNRARVQQIANALLKADSGAAVTLSEDQRAALANMLTGKFSEATARKQLKEVVLPMLDDIRSNALAGVSPEAVEEYNTRYRRVQGDFDWTAPLPQLKKWATPGAIAAGRPAASASAPAAASAPAGVPPEIWNVMTPQEKALWQKK